MHFRKPSSTCLNKPDVCGIQQLVFSTIRLIARISSHNWRLKYSWLTQRIGGSLSLLGYQSPQFHWPGILVTSWSLQACTELSVSTQHLAAS